MSKAAVINGTFLRPGVSKNKRLYTSEAIGKAVARMKEAISTPSGLPITMATSHGAAYGDDALSSIGKITKVWQDSDGSAKFSADIADTTNGRDIASAANGGFIKGLSIRGGWMSKPTMEEDDTYGRVETADDMMVVGVDFTSRPGVEGAQVENVQMVESAGIPAEFAFSESVEETELVETFKEEVPEETNSEAEEDAFIQSVIQEAVETAVAAVEEKKASKEPYGDVTYADPGYQKDKKKRYPINTASHVRAAWSYINMPKNHAGYTSAQVARIKSRIKSAAKKFGIDIQESYNNAISEMVEIAEAYVSMSLYNGVGDISVSGSTQEPKDIRPLAQKLAMTLLAALDVMDPDMDGDVDLDGAEENATPVQQAESNDDASNQTKEESAMTTDAKTAEEAAASTETPEAPAAPTLAEADIQAIAAALAKQLAPAAPAAPAAPVAEENKEEASVAEGKTFSQADFDAAVKEAADKAVAEAKAAAAAEYQNEPTRKGLVSETLGESFGEDEEEDARKLSKLSPFKFQETASAVFDTAGFPSARRSGFMGL